MNQYDPQFKCGKCGVVHHGPPNPGHPEDITATVNSWLLIYAVLFAGALLIGVLR